MDRAAPTRSHRDEAITIVVLKIQSHRAATVIAIPVAVLTIRLQVVGGDSIEEPEYGQQNVPRGENARWRYAPLPTDQTTARENAMAGRSEREFR